jgi:hypothetical protein
MKISLKREKINNFNLISEYEILDEFISYFGKSQLSHQDSSELTILILQEQSKGHAKDLQKTEKKLEFWNNNPVKPPFKPHVKIEDRLCHLRVKESWDD